MDCIAYQTPLSMGFPRQVCWSGLPFPSPFISLKTNFFLAVLHGTWDFISLTRDGTRTPCIGSTKSFFLIYNFIYVFIFGCTGSSSLPRLFSSCGKWGLLSSSDSWASHRCGFSRCRAPTLGHSGSVAVAPAP